MLLFDLSAYRDGRTVHPSLLRLSSFTSVSFDLNDTGQRAYAVDYRAQLVDAGGFKRYIDYGLIARIARIYRAHLWC